MKTDKIFTIGKEYNDTLVFGYYYNISTGARVASDDSLAIMKKSIGHSRNSRIKIVTGRTDLANMSRTCVLMWDKRDNYLGFQDAEFSASGVLDVVLIYEEAASFAVYTAEQDYSGPTTDTQVTVTAETEVIPHYKELKKKYQKENGQMFFRESLEGKITLWAGDYEYVKDASLEDNLIFRIYKNGNRYASASFNKSDCKFDHFRESVELKLTYGDKYSKILDAYENTYDLIKTEPAMTPLTLTKRSVVQIYVQGENVVSNYSGGTYWETEVNEQVNDQGLLANKYHFAKGPKYIEVSLQGFGYAINAAYRGVGTSNTWRSACVWLENGVITKRPCSIVFTKMANAGPAPVRRPEVHYMSTGTGSAIASGGTAAILMYDSYRIDIYEGDTLVYQSDDWYGKDTDNFTLAAGSNLYLMRDTFNASPIGPTPRTFYLGAYVIEYQIWGRILCDVDSFQRNGETIETYDLPYDDFATARRNYKRCIGVIGFDSQDSVIRIYQNQKTSEKPTAYGVNDFGEYFIPPYILGTPYFYPLARSTWANTSMWVMLDETGAPYGFEYWNKQHYKEYTLKNAYHIADVIKSLLAKIDPTITHEKTSDYSQFLYGHQGSSAAYLGNCDLYITQKSNILKGEYDQAAQKAEIKFKQIMEMLRDCFRCYWYIDDQNRLRIEHVSYFINGLSYYGPSVQLNLQNKTDKFNKKSAIYCQRELEFDKTDLTSRYEFEWADDVTDSMGNLKINVNNKYIQKDKTEQINIDGFTSDVDYMLFLPDDFSSDGFALLMADSNKKVPIVHQTLVSEQQSNTYDIYAQNWYASFNQMAQHYMYDMPGRSIDYNNVVTDRLTVRGIKKCMKQTVEFPSKSANLSLYRLIKTDEGNGYIESITENIDTYIANVELRYEPR